MTRTLFILAAALGLAACVNYGYEYDYDPYLGPHGHYLGPFESQAHRPDPACAQVAFDGPFEDGWRGPYISGPRCIPPPPAG